MTEAKVSSKTPATTAKKGKGEKEREVITRIKDLLPQWEIQKVEAFCAEHGHDLEKIHAALDGSFERTGHQPDDWQVMTKKEQKPKRGGFGGSRDTRESPRPRDDRPRGERAGRGRGGAESSRGGGRGRGGGDRRGGRGGASTANRSKDNGSSNPAVTDSSISVDNAPSTTETWGSDNSAQDSKPETTAEWGASSSPVASTPAVASVPPVPSRAVEQPTEKKMSWAQKASAGAAKKAQLSELQSAEAFPPQQSQQILGPAVVHVQPAIPAGPSYRAALQGNSRWGPKKPEPVVEQTDTSMVPLEQQTAALTIDAYQPSDTYTSGQVDDNTNNAVGSTQDNNDVTTASSDVLNSISDVQQDQATSSFPQAEAFQPESSFQQPQQTDNSFQIYQASQNQPSVPEQQTPQATVYSQTVSSSSGFDDIRPQNFSQDNNNSGKTVIDLLAAANSVILPHVEPAASFGIEFGSFGQAPSAVYSNAQPEPVQQQPEAQPVAVAQQQQPPLTEQNTPTETQQQQQLPQSFVSTLREDSLPAKQTSVDNSGSQFSAQNQFYQGQNQSQSVPPPSQPQSQTQSQQPASYRGPSGSYDHHYAGGYPFPGYDNSSPYYGDFAARDNQQSYQPNYDYSSQFRGGATGGGSRRPATNTNAPYYPSPTTRGPTDGSSGNASPPTSEPVSPKSASFSKPTSFAPKPSFNSNPTKIPPQIPTYTGKPTGVPPNAGGYNKPPATATQASQKSFKPPSQPQGAQSQHHPDPHYMYPPGVYGAYPYPYPYQAPGQPMPPGFMHPQMPYAPYDPRYGYAPYPSPVQSFEGDYEQYSKPGAHYSEGGTTPRGATEWSGQNADGQQKPSNASAPGANTPSSASALPSSMNSAKNTVAPGANKKRFEYEDPHYNSGYGFTGAPASSPMAMHAAAAPYQPTNYGQPILHAMGGQAPYGGGQYEAHPRGYTGGSWQ